MSNSNVRLYEVYERTDAAKKLVIKGLAVKEKEFVVSNVSKSKAWADAEAGLAETDVRKKVAIAPEHQITEQAILDHFAPLLTNDLHVWDAVKGVFLNEAVEPEPEV